MNEPNCPSCGAAVQSGARYCLSCGTKLVVHPLEGVARCAQHPDVQATQTCPRCGSFVCATCLISQPGGEELCTACVGRDHGALLPWDRRAELGTMRAYFKTCLTLMGSPGLALSKAPQGGTVGSSLLFAMISSYAAMLTTFALYALLGVAMLGFAKRWGGGDSTDAMKNFPLLAMQIYFGVMALVGPPIGAVFSLALSALDHLALRIVGAKPVSWEVTWRGYALGMAPSILGVIPVEIRDAGYDFVARNRTRWFGRTQACRLPTVSERHRFL